MSRIRHDLRYGLRLLRRSPLFSAVAIASLALGIGVNTAAFSLVNAILLRPLPVERPAEVVSVYTSDRGGIAFGSSSWPDYLDLRASASPLAGLVAYSSAFVNLDTGGVSRLAMAEVVSANYFDVLGIRPALGRGFRPDEERDEGAHAVVVIAERLWRRAFAASPEVLGRTLRIRGGEFAIVGVAQASFTGLTPGVAPELWVPASMVSDVEPVGLNDVVPSPTGRTRLERRGSRWLFLKGRLAPGATPQGATASLQATMTRLEREHPATNLARGITVVPPGSVRIHPLADDALRPTAAVSMAVVAVVLLIACANVANMLLARASGRRREIAIRLAVGAGRAALVGQLVVESLVLAALAALVGVGLGSALLSALVAFPPPLPLEIPLDVHMDWRVLAFATAVSAAAGVLFGLVPALQASRPDLVAALRNEAAALDVRGVRGGARRTLVAAQMAMSIVLLVAAVLLTRSLVAAARTDVGFRPDGVVMATVDMDMHRYGRARAAAFFEQATERLRGLAGVGSVAVANRVPFSLNVHESGLFVHGREYAPDDRGIQVDVTSATPDYFDLFGIPIVAGRAFDAHDREGMPGVVVVSQALAARLWPGESPIGKRVRTDNAASGPEYEVIGVSRDYRIRTVGEAPRPVAHFARLQRPEPYGTFLVRTTLPSADALAAVQRELRALEPQLLVADLRPMRSAMAVTLFPVRAGAVVIGTFGVIALLMAAVGLYGVTAYAVVLRTREIGIRVALGCARSSVVRLVVAEGMAPPIAGLVLGITGAAVLARALSSVLFGVGPLDLASYGVAAGLMLGVALVANLVPARRAAGIDPSVALRQG